MRHTPPSPERERLRASRSSSRVALCSAMTWPLAWVFLTDFRTGAPRSHEGFNSASVTAPLAAGDLYFRLQ